MTQLTKQEQRVFDYILIHRGATTREIINATYITCPSGRITEMRKKGVNIISIGHRKYEGAHPFEMYAIGEPAFLEQVAEVVPAAKQLAIAV